MEEPQQTNEENQVETQGKQKKPHKWLKRFGLFILIVVVGLYLMLDYGQFIIEKTVKDNILSANKILTRQGITVDNVTIKTSTDFTQTKTHLSRIKVFNPNPNQFISTFAISIGEVTMVGDFDNKGPNRDIFVIDDVILEDVTINYDVNARRNVNLHQLLDTITQVVAPNKNFSAFTLLDPRYKGITLKYKGNKFIVKNLYIAQPTINLFMNNNLNKTIAARDIYIQFKDLKQPTDYASLLLYSSVQVLDVVETTIEQKS